MGFKNYLLSEAGNPHTTFSKDMEAENPDTGETVHFHSKPDYDASVEHSEHLKGLFEPGKIVDKGQKGIPLGQKYPYWDKEKNQIFIVIGGEETSSPSDYELGKGGDYADVKPPESKSEMDALVAKGVDMSIFDKKVDKKHTIKEPSTDDEYVLAKELKRAIITMKHVRGDEYSAKNAEGIEYAKI